MERRDFLKLSGAAMATSMITSANASELDQLNAAGPVPSEAQQEWMKLGYGMFLHYGPNTVSNVAWGDGKFPAANFVLKNLDTDQWARVAKEAGMKYAVLTTKHHDGFCLWP